jgi:GNAT superfamily N-acetyltransferase
MGAIEDFPIVHLGEAEADAAMALSTEALWDQTKEDWRFFLINGYVFGIRDASQLIATAALLPYSDGNAWIGMVLVTAAWRRRGLAKRLLDVCLDKARELDLTCWLDATPAGALVYGPLGFEPAGELARLSLPRDRQSAGPPCAVSTIDALAARERDAVGFDRGDLLKEFARRPGSRVVSSGESITLIRDGRTSRHVGPIYAQSADNALRLVDAIAHSERAPLMIDAVACHETFLNGLIDKGWRVERPFQRMRSGRSAAVQKEMPFAVAGPEFG